jgi:hypothetical protein
MKSDSPAEAEQDKAYDCAPQKANGSQNLDQRFVVTVSYRWNSRLTLKCEFDEFLRKKTDKHAAPEAYDNDANPSQNTGQFHAAI